MICPLFPGGTKYAASCLDGAPNPDLARSEFGPCPDCPVDFGPWGEWRSAGGRLTDLSVYLTWWLEDRLSGAAWDGLYPAIAWFHGAAVGWSP